MESIVLASVTALWLGIMTSISPCPLATNIAAISFIGRRVGSKTTTIFSGLSYTLGRIITYIILGIVVIKGLMSIPGVSNFLQEYMNLALGPMLIVVGIILLGIISFNLPGISAGKKSESIASRGGIAGAGILGMIFALSLCPVSAALFFGSLIPLSIKHQSPIILPLVYGIGTGLPVVLFAFLVAFGANAVARAFNRLTQIELWIRRITGVVFIMVGVYYSLIYIFKVPLL
jgi:cytochrome c biogenesis protein CcdA